MQFRYFEVATLPRLAWCARITRDDDTVAVFHGSQVETHARGFVEGAWSGPFDAFDLAGATVVCGTGGVADADQVRFSTSTDQESPLFSIRDGHAVHVSNSPAFVLRMTGEETDAIYPCYVYDLIAIFRQGLHCPDGLLKLRSRRTLRVHYTAILSIDRRGRVRFDRHRVDDAPIDFRSYESTLKSRVRDVLANAADPVRTHRYAPLAMLSRGYDSTASTVLARDAGAVDAVSYVDSRHEEPDRDCAAANAQALGMRCTVHDRWRYLERDEPAEVEFGYGPLSSHVSLAALEPQLAGRLLVIGQNGDQVWNPLRARAFDAMSRCWSRFAAGLTEIEFRLRVGYAAFAPPCIAAQHNRALHAIATSADMRPWAIGGAYDRPIPRRIGEEAGLARDAFGMRKAATSHTHLNDASRFSRRALESYRSFVHAQHAGVAPRERTRWQARAHWRRRMWDLVSPQQRFVRTDRLQRRMPFLLNAPPLPLPWEFMFTFQWTAATLRYRYRVQADNPSVSAQSRAP